MICKFKLYEAEIWRIPDFLKVKGNNLAECAKFTSAYY